MNAATKARLLGDLTGKRARERTADEARALKGALLDAIKKKKIIYTTRPNWETGHPLTWRDYHWIKDVLVRHGVSVPRGTESDQRLFAIRYGFMPYTIVENGAPAMARRILTLEIPEPRDPFLPPPGLTTVEVLDRIIGMTKGIRL